MMPTIIPEFQAQRNMKMSAKSRVPGVGATHTSPSSSRSQALPGNAYREAPPPLPGAGAFANKVDYCRNDYA